MGFLSQSVEAERLDHAALMQRVIAQGGPGGYRQVMALIGLRLRGYRIDIKEFYQFALWRKTPETRQMLREFQPESQRRTFNAALLMPVRGDATATIVDKLQTELVFEAAGLPHTRTLACLGTPPVNCAAVQIHNAAELRAFLTTPGQLPLFGKPRADSLARGAVVIERLGEDGNSAVLLDGRIAPLDDLIREITDDWGGGYLFQPFYRTHSALAPHVGPAMASVRIVSVLTERGCEIYYAMLRIPVRGAMHDGEHRGMRLWALIDPASGAITRLRNVRDAMTPDLTHWLDKDTPLLGLVLPHWDQAIAAVMRAHALFPGHGLLGWDVFLTDAGALLNEVNATPRDVYQAAALRGVNNPDLRPIYDRALAFATRINAAG